jgi:hypothetical protein
MLGAIELETGAIWRVVSGTGAGLLLNPSHPDIGRPILGTKIPSWENIQALIKDTAPIFAGIGTQSWDVAITDRGPVLLEANFGGDLNLAQLATGKGALDERYRKHLMHCG